MTMTHAVAVAVGPALLDLPALNRAWSEDAWLQLLALDAGIAIDTPRGLSALVLTDAGR
jgi:pyruvate/2-oxoglutarate dehydrogenase complex dihydrolipoamide acyltransferase (E2) component